jgi:phosphoglycerate-specific signal transduction histidine kinase
LGLQVTQALLSLGELTQPLFSFVHYLFSFSQTKPIQSNNICQMPTNGNGSKNLINILETYVKKREKKRRGKGEDPNQAPPRHLTKNCVSLVVLASSTDSRRLRPEPLIHRRRSEGGGVGNIINKNRIICTGGGNLIGV